MLKDLLDRAKRVAEEHLPEDVLDAGRKLGRSVAAHAPAPLAEVIHYVTEESDQAKTSRPGASGSTEAKASEFAAGSTEAKASSPSRPKDSAEAKSTEVKASSASSDGGATAEAKPAEAKPAEAKPAEAKPAEGEASTRIGPLLEDPQVVLARVKTKAARGLKPEDRLVVIYATPDEQQDVEAIEEILQNVEAEIRHNDLRREPQTARQLAKLTGVMVPPYVFINGRHWGNRYDIESLSVSGDLTNVVANLLDDISEEARRIGHLQKSFSDELSVENIIGRWKQGHILCVDDLDSWFESERGTERFYYQGGPRPVEDMREVAEEIVAAVEADEYEAIWQLEPSVHLP